MTKIFKPLFAICLIACLFLANNGWCAVSREDWKEQLIEKGRQQLLDTQLRNIQNDVRGESHLNSYVVLVNSSANAYPNSDYIQQKKGKRGSEEIGDYMLTQDQLTRLNELLASYNSKNDISTYLLLVDHMPLDFIDVIPDEQTITDIINSKKSEDNFTKYVTEQALEDARDIVESITAPLLEQLKSPTLYCGLVNFKVYKNEKEGKGFTIYYPRNSAINFDSQYRHMLASFVSQQKSPQWTNNYEKVRGIIEAIRLNNEEYGKTKGLFADLTDIVDPELLFQKISSLSVNGLSSFDVDQRLHILKVLSSDGLNDDEETLALNIFKASPVKDAGDFLKGLKEVNEFHGDKDALLNCLLGSTQDAIMGFWGEDNFKSLANELVRLWSASVSLSTQYETIVSNIPENRIFYRGESSESGNGVNYRESSYLPSSIASNGQLSLKGFYKLELKGKVLADDAVQITETLDPFETIGLVFLSPPANDILGSAGTGKVIPLPAIAYHCYDTKAWTNAEQKTAIDIVQLASVAVAIGEIQSARQAWRVWAAWGDLAVNAPDFILQNEQVRQQILALPGGGEFLFYWDRCVLIANGVYLSPFAYQFARGLVSSSVRLSAQLPEIVGKQWQDVNNLFTKLDEGYELRLVGKGVAKGVSKSKLLAKLDNLPDARSFVNSLDEVVADATLLNKIENLNQSQLEGLNTFYKNRQSPAGFTKTDYNFIAAKTIEGQPQPVSISYKHGFPEFHNTSYCPTMSFADGSTGKFKYVNNNLKAIDYSEHFKWANEELAKKFGKGTANWPPKNAEGFHQVGNYRWNGKSAQFELKNANGRWEKYTWHHFEDGKTIIPVLSDVHSPGAGGFTHSGGNKILEGDFKGVFEFTAF